MNNESTSGKIAAACAALALAISAHAQDPEIADQDSEVLVAQPADDVREDSAPSEELELISVDDLPSIDDDEFDEEEETHVPVVTGAFKQWPLTPAWAITIHKSQGKTLSGAGIDLGRSAFAPGASLVATPASTSRHRWRPR